MKSKSIPSKFRTTKEKALIAEAKKNDVPTEDLPRPDILDRKADILSRSGTSIVTHRHNPLKSPRKRASSIVKTNKFQAKSYATRMKEKQEFREMKEQENSLKELMRSEKAEERRKAEQRKLQKEENAKKGLVTQKITTKALKKLTPKQMKNIMKM